MMADFFYHDNETNFGILGLFAVSVLEAFICLYVFGAWDYFQNVYVRAALMYCWVSVGLQFADHFSKFLLKLKGELK